MRFIYKFIDYYQFTMSNAFVQHYTLLLNNIFHCDKESQIAFHVSGLWKIYKKLWTATVFVWIVLMIHVQY